MTKLNKSINLVAVLIILIAVNSHGQTQIAKEQIEDAFLLKTGGALYGDVQAATSSIEAASFQLASPDGVYTLVEEPPHAVIRSNRDLLLDPTNNGTASAVIIPATVIRFPTELGRKIEFHSQSYHIGVSAFDLDITSDRNIKFHSDTVDDLMIVAGDEGDVLSKRDIIAGRDLRANNTIGFTQETVGDKILLFGTLYRLAISPSTMDFYSDRDFKWHSDVTSNAMSLDAETGQLTLTGPLQLPVFTSLPGGSVGRLIYLDHPSDDTQDGAYIYTGVGWQQL